MKSIKVSVIIPVFNCEEYLEKCLISIINQTLKEIEIIVVNDGSIDGTEEIIRKYSRIDKRIFYIFKANNGQASARNDAIKLAKGKYISFVDADDCIHSEMLEKMYLKATENNLDICSCGMVYEYHSKNITVEPLNTIKINEALIDPLMSSACNKIYKNDLIKNVKFLEKVKYEDLYFNVISYLKSKEVSYVKEPYYYYNRKNNNSTMNNVSYRVTDILIVLKEINLYYLENHYSYYDVEIEFINIYYTILTKSFTIYKMENIKVKKQSLKRFSEHLTNNFPDWKSNEILKKMKFKQKAILLIYNIMIYLNRG